MLDPNDPNVRIAVFGQVVQDFLKSDVGDFLLRKAQEEANDAMDLLKKAPPEDALSIRELQNRIWRAESIMNWLGEAIETGLQAKEQLEEENHGS